MWSERTRTGAEQGLGDVLDALPVVADQEREWVTLPSGREASPRVVARSARKQDVVEGGTTLKADVAFSPAHRLSVFVCVDQPLRHVRGHETPFERAHCRCCEQRQADAAEEEVHRAAGGEAEEAACCRPG